MYACQDHSGKSSGALLPRWEIEQATGTVVCVLRLSLAHVVGFVYIATGLGYRLKPRIVTKHSAVTITLVQTRHCHQAPCGDKYPSQGLRAL